MQSIIMLIARLLLAPLFLGSGISKIVDFGGTVEEMEAFNVPIAPVMLVGAATLEILGVLSLLLGFKARIGAILLLAFLIPVTLIMHAFWTFDDPEMIEMQQIQFFKNLAIMSGLMMFVTFGGGRISMDGWLNRRKRG